MVLIDITHSSYIFSVYGFLGVAIEFFICTQRSIDLCLKRTLNFITLLKI